MKTSSSVAQLWPQISAALPASEDQFPLLFGDTVESSVLDLLKRSRRHLYSQTSNSSLSLNAQIVLDYSWEKLNTGTWRDVDKEWRRVYSYGCLFKVAALCRGGPSEDELRQAIRTCDMGLLMGAAIMDNILQVIVWILQSQFKKSCEDGDDQGQPEVKVSELQQSMPNLFTREPQLS